MDEDQASESDVAGEGNTGNDVEAAEDAVCDKGTSADVEIGGRVGRAGPGATAAPGAAARDGVGPVDAVGISADEVAGPLAKLDGIDSEPGWLITAWSTLGPGDSVTITGGGMDDEAGVEFGRAGTASVAGPDAEGAVLTGDARPASGATPAGGALLGERGVAARAAVDGAAIAADVTGATGDTVVEARSVLAVGAGAFVTDGTVVADAVVGDTVAEDGETAEGGGGGTVVCGSVAEDGAAAGITEAPTSASVVAAVPAGAWIAMSPLTGRADASGSVTDGAGAVSAFSGAVVVWVEAAGSIDSEDASEFMGVEGSLSVDSSIDRPSTCVDVAGVAAMPVDGSPVVLVERTISVRSVGADAKPGSPRSSLS